MTDTELTELRAALDDYRRGVGAARAAVLDARARVERAEAAIAEVGDVLRQRRRRAEKRAAKRAEQRGTP